MNNKIFILFRLLLGFILCATSTVLMLNSNLGLSPWDVFHQGVSGLTGITIGQASIMVGFVCVGIGIILGEKVGFGTILNMILVGQFMDIIMNMNIIPVSNNILISIIMMLIGMFIMGLGCVLYIGCGIGCGPRDGLMVGLSKKFNKSIKFIRSFIEISVLILGYFLGGKVGLGTVITAIALGYCIQLTFKICRFDVTKVKHKSLSDGIKKLKIN
ncbi:YczE/YyaS/YitT family protein [Clostridium tarantellae]|nr:hypothetical protein [Clostridium tarantellae]